MANTVTSSQLFYNKLNEANPNLPHPLDETNISVATPVANSNGSIAKNSQVNITGLVGSPYSGTATAYYDRVALADIIATVPNSTTFPLGSQTKISDVLTDFNNTFNVNMVASDIIDGPLPAASATTGQISFTLAIAATSLAFSGTADLVLQPADISLTSFPTMNLNGMTVTYVNARSYTPDAQMVLSLINSDNSSIGRLLATSNTTVTAPTALSGDASGLNTSVTVTGTAGQGFKDQAIFKYNRVSLADIIAQSTTGNTSTTVPNTNQATQQDMINSFNTAYGAKLTLADVQPASISNLGGGYQGITLTPVDGHYLFNGPATIQFLQSYPTLTLSGGLTATASTNVTYYSSLAISGGDGVYENPTVASGSLPTGLGVSVDGSNLVVSGTPTGTGSSSFTLRVQSSDGQTVTSPVQSIAVTANVANVVTSPNLNGLVFSDIHSTSITAVAAVIARINNNNPSLPTPFTLSNVTLGTPTALSGDPSGLNTSVTLTGNSPYTGTTTIKYNRLDITTDVFTNGLGTTAQLNTQSSYTNGDALLADLNAKYGLDLQTSDVVNNAISNNAAGQTYPLVMAAGSYAFTGTLTVTFLASIYMQWFQATNNTASTTISGNTATFAKGLSGYAAVMGNPTYAKHGKYYFEVNVTSYGGGGTANGPGPFGNGSPEDATQIMHWYPITSAGIYGIAVDATTPSATKIWVRAKSSSWVSGDPVAGTSPSYTVNYTQSGGTGMVPGFIVNGNSTGPTVATLITDPSQLNFGIPSGYNAFTNS